MTSKNLFFKLMKQDLKKRIWYPILLFIVIFLALDVPMLMRLEVIAESYPEYIYPRQQFYVENILFGRDLNIAALLVILAALVCAISGFAYLHSKVQIDTYHSMPVKRTELFASRYLSGVLQFLVPFVIHVAVCLLIAAVRNIFSTHMLFNSIYFVFYELLIFLVTYSVCIMAVCLTGNVIINVLGAVVIFVYSTVMYVLKEAMFEAFFHTYINLTGLNERFPFSPLGLYIKLTDIIERMDVEGGAYNFITDYDSIINFDYNMLGGLILPFIIQTVAYTAISLVLYLKRPSEAAGRSIAFGWAEPVIKTFVAIPLVIYIGLFFMGISVSNSFGWCLFGVILSFVIIMPLMEIIFRLDIRAALNSKKQLLFNAACTALIVIIFRYDVLGYNTYVPLDTQLQSCAISIDGLLSHAAWSDDGYSDYIRPRNYRMQNMELIDNPSVMALARKAAGEGLNFADYSDFQSYEAYEELASKQADYHSIVVGYKLLNGKTIYRYYVIDVGDAETYRLLSEIFDTYDYKMGATPLLNEGLNIKYADVAFRNNFYYDNVHLSGNMQEKLLEAYQNDYMKLTLDDVVNKVPIGSIYFSVNEISVSRPDIEAERSYPVYPQFTNTIELALSYGFDFNKELDVDDVESIFVYYAGREDIEIYADGIKTVAARRTDDDTNGLEYTNKDALREIAASLAYTSFRRRSYDYASDLWDESYQIAIDFVGGDVSHARRYMFRSGEIPDFVTRDFSYVK